MECPLGLSVCGLPASACYVTVCVLDHYRRYILSRNGAVEADSDTVRGVHSCACVRGNGVDHAYGGVLQIIMACLEHRVIGINAVVDVVARNDVMLKGSFKEERRNVIDAEAVFEIVMGTISASEAVVVVCRRKCGRMILPFVRCGSSAA